MNGPTPTQEWMAAITRRHDLRLPSATDGDSGIEIARATLPGLILMDINLPGISGVKAFFAPPKILNSWTLIIDKRESNFGLLGQMPIGAIFTQDSHPFRQNRSL